MPGGFYENDRILEEYLLFHYGRSDEILPYPEGPHCALDYPRRCVIENIRPDELPTRARGLDLGCAVGRSAFELARFCDSVIGIDYSARFIEAADRLKREGVLPYRYTIEGGIRANARAVVPDGLPRERVSFRQGDAMHLPDDLGSFDVVLMANLIDRLSDPGLCLSRLAELVTPGGQLIITSPYTWMEEFTPPANWIGGKVVDGNAVHTGDGLRKVLDSEFHFIAARNMPFLIREHARKFQWSVAEATLWRRKNP